MSQLTTITADMYSRRPCSCQAKARSVGDLELVSTLRGLGVTLRKTIGVPTGKAVVEWRVEIAVDNWRPAVKRPYHQQRRPALETKQSACVSVGGGIFQAGTQSD